MAQDLPRAKRANVLRDPRFIAGVALIIVSVLLTTWLLQKARGGEELYQLTAPVAEGQPIKMSQVSIVSARTGSDAYVPVGQIPEGAVATRSLGAGELLPRSAVSTKSAQDRRQVVVNVSTRIPSSVGVGSHVDLWGIDAPGALETQKSEPQVIATSAIILAISEPDSSMLDRAQSIELSVTREDLPNVLAATGSNGALIIVPAG